MKLAPKQLDTSKNLEMEGGKVILTSGSAIAPSIGFKDNQDTGFYVDENGKLCMAVGGSNVMHLDVDGSVNFASAAALRIPSGDTAERPSLVSNGLIRFNDETGEYEVSQDDVWQNLVLSNDDRLFSSNQIVVSKNPGPGQFASVKAAIESLDTESLSPGNQIYISVQNGSYSEAPFTLPPYVHIIGSSSSTCHLVTNNTNATFITAYHGSSLNSIAIVGASGANGVGLHIEGSDVPREGGSQQVQPIVLNHATFATHRIAIQVHNHAHDLATQLQSTGLTIASFEGSFRGLEITAEGGKACIVKLTDPVFQSAASDIEDVIYISGSGALLAINDLHLENQLLDSNSTEIWPYNVSPVATGIRVRDGGTVNVVSGGIVGFNKNIFIENAGAAPRFACSALSSTSPGPYVFYNEHPGCYGIVSGAFARSKVFSVESTGPKRLALTFQDQESTSLVNTGGLVIGQTFDELVDVADLITYGSSVGLIKGGRITLSQSDPFTVSIEAGVGYVMANSDVDSPTKKISWSTQDVVLPALSSGVLYFNSDNVLSQGPEPDAFQNVILGRVLVSDIGVSVIENTPNNAHHTSSFLSKMLKSVAGVIYESGSLVSENATSPLKIDVSSGAYWYGDTRVQVVGGTALTFAVLPADGINSSSDTIDNANYYPVSGVTPLDTGKFVKHALWTFGDGDNEQWVIVPGDVQFDTLLEAESGPLPTPPSFFSASFALVSLIVAQEGNSNIVQIYDARSTLGFKSPSVNAASTHGNLLGLDSDDHPQYLLASGQRGMTGDLDLNGHDLVDVGQINGISFSTHGSRHNPNGSDPLATAAPSGQISATSVNSEGVANSFARSDHTHALTGVQAQSNELTALAGLNSTGLVARTAGGTYSPRTIAGTTGQITITNGNGVSGNPTIALVDNVALPGSAGITLPMGLSSARPTDVVPANLRGILRYSTTDQGLEYHNGTTWVALRGESVWTYSGDVSGTNGTANSVSVTLTLADLGSSGTYTKVVVDSKGRVTSGSNPTTLSGYGITDALATSDAVTTATANKLLRLDANGLLPASVTGNAATATLATTATSAGKWTTARTVAWTGDVTGSTTLDGSANSSISMVLANSGVTVGSYNNVTVDAKGRVTAASNVSYLTANQTITASGDVTGTGSTSLALTLANVGTAGTYTRVTTDAKGRITTGVTRTITGTANQITVTNGDQVAGNPTLALAANPVLPGTGAVTIPSGTSAQVPAVPTAGMMRYNSTADRYEAYRGGEWKRLFTYNPSQGVVVQIDTGSIPAVTTTGRIPFDTSVPSAFEGTQVFSTVFTPLSTTSSININLSCTVATSSSNVNVILALFRGTTCIASTVASFATKATNDMQSVSVNVTDIPASVAAQTYSLRVGASLASTTYVNTNNVNYLGGTMANSGWMITEISQ
jgi:hypothetical protein